MSETLDQIRSIVGSLSVPLVADLDTGYGNALNVRRTVEQSMDAGVAEGILEDQQWPKRCGHMEEKRVVDADKHARRIRAAADVRDEREADFVIIGRTDAREPHGPDEALRRGHVYADAGADVVSVEAPQSRAELEAVADEFAVPTFANMLEGGRTPYLPADTVGYTDVKMFDTPGYRNSSRDDSRRYEDLAAIGFDIVVYPLVRGDAGAPRSLRGARSRRNGRSSRDSRLRRGRGSDRRARVLGARTAVRRGVSRRMTASVGCAAVRGTWPDSWREIKNRNERVRIDGEPDYCLGHCPTIPRI